MSERSSDIRASEQTGGCAAGPATSQAMPPRGKRGPQAHPHGPWCGHSPERGYRDAQGRWVCRDCRLERKRRSVAAHPPQPDPWPQSQRRIEYLREIGRKEHV